MNWKKIFTIVALTGFSASVATGQGTAPTIVQGDYISNVFGNSNFIKNPNAKLNTKDVTVSSATVSRSATTPLVATSEFNVAVTSANGTIVWATRSFDAGMKNQNCEARFTYRGFQATSKVHIKQGANTVASLNLSPTGTDPRIASINFPCGDLSAATTFVVTDTAILAGTNEISGIYTGLATNMANVAQAEEVGTYEVAGTTNCNWSRTGAGSNVYGNFAADADCNTGVVTGAADTSQGKIPGARFNNLKPGKYMFIVDYTLYRANTLAGDVRGRLSDGTNVSNGLLYLSPVTSDTSAPATSVLTVEYTSVTSPIIQLQGLTSQTSNSVLIFNGEPTQKLKIVAYRFPTSSELVVTPERQNTFAGVKLQGSGFSNFVTSNAWAKLTSASTLTRTTFGKAKVESNNDHSITIENMPVGNYFISYTGLLGVDQPGSGSTTYCRFALADSATGGWQIGGAQVVSTGDATSANQENDGQTIGGIYNNTSVGARTFYLQGRRTTGAGRCYAYTDGTTGSTISVIPLDQPSNSALYVEGPVKASATGAAISAGYVGEKKTVHIGSATNVPSSGAWYNLGNMTLTTGVWSCTLNGSYEQNGATFTSVGNALFAFSDAVAPTGPAYSYQTQGATAGGIWPTSFVYGTLSIPPMILLSNGSQITWPDGVTRGTTTLHISGFLSTYTAGTPRYYMRAECVRLN